MESPDIHTGQHDILNGSAGMTSPAERAEALDRVRSQSLALVVLACAVSSWTIFLPRPPALAVLALASFPWMAVVLASRSGGVLRVLRSKKDAGPDVSLAFILPSIALARATEYLQVLHWQPMLILTAVAGTALCAGALLADPWLRSAGRLWLGLLVVGAAWGYGAGLEADVLLDQSPATMYSASVVGKSISHGRHTSYHLYLAPWGPELARSTASVSPGFYRSVQIGDAVCLPVKSGALFVGWYEVRSCR